ncbi:MAG TPA: hypothetical protein VGG30_02740, partial [Pirellulales bacterium]
MHPELPTKPRAAYVWSLLFTLTAWTLTAITSASPATAADATSPNTAAPSTASTDAASPSTAGDIPAKRAKVADEIAQLTKTKQAAVAGGEAAGAVDPADEQIELLGALDLVYVQRQAVAEHHDELSHVHDRLQAQLDNQHKFGPPEAKPYSFLLLESIRDSLATQQERE